MKAHEYPALTVNQLWKICIEQRKQGNGNKKILISSDDEGNGFHGLFYGITDDQKSIKEIADDGLMQDPECENMLNDIVLLG